MSGVLDAYDMAPVGPAPQPQRPSSTLETLGAGFRLAVDDSATVQDTRRNAAYRSIEQALVDQGQDRRRYRYAPLFDEGYDANAGFNVDAVWADVIAARRRDPKAFADLPATQADFEKQIATRGGARARDQQLLANGGFAAGLAGGVAGSFADPLNILSLPFSSGGKTVASVFAREALLNGAIEAIEQPFLAGTRRTMGEDLSLGDAASNIGMAALGGGVLGGGLHLGGKGYDAALEGIFNRLPEHLQARWASAMRLDDIALADIAPDVIGRDIMTPDQVAAAQVLRRDGEVALANPFVPSAVSGDVHGARLREAMQAVLDGERPSFAARAQAGSAIGTGIVPVPRETAAVASSGAGYLRVIRAAESSGNDLAQAETSSAFGRYQFTKGTWLSYYLRRFGRGGLTNEQIYAKRADGALQEQLVRDLTADSMVALRRAGLGASDANLYMLHFAGPGDGIDLLRGAPGARVADIMDPRSVRSNPWLKDWTAGELRAWAERKTGSNSVQAEDRVAAPSAGAAADVGNEAAALRAAELRADEASVTADAERLARGDDPSRSEPVMFDKQALGADEWVAGIARLRAAGDGEIPNAIVHPAIGPIDVIWGDRKGGLAHIVAKHPEVNLDELPELIGNMDVASTSDNRIRLETPDHSAVVRLDRDGVRQTWLLTAFEKRDRGPALAEDGRASADGKDGSPRQGELDLTSSIGKSQLLKDFWDRARNRGEKPRSVWAAIANADNSLAGWSVSRGDANRLASRLDGDWRVMRVSPDDADVLAMHPMDSADPHDLAEIDALISGSPTASPGGVPIEAELAQPRFADPHGADADAQVQSLEHDLRMLADGDGAHVVEVDDAAGAVTMRDLFDALDAEEAELAALRQCALPVKQGGAT